MWLVRLPFWGVVCWLLASATGAGDLLAFLTIAAALGRVRIGVESSVAALLVLGILEDAYSTSLWVWCGLGVTLDLLRWLGNEYLISPPEGFCRVVDTLSVLFLIVWPGWVLVSGSLSWVLVWDTVWLVTLAGFHVRRAGWLTRYRRRDVRFAALLYWGAAVAGAWGVADVWAESSRDPRWQVVAVSGAVVVAGQFIRLATGVLAAVALTDADSDWSMWPRLRDSRERQQTLFTGGIDALLALGFFVVSASVVAGDGSLLAVAAWALPPTALLLAVTGARSREIGLLYRAADRLVLCDARPEDQRAIAERWAQDRVLRRSGTDMSLANDIVVLSRVLERRFRHSKGRLRHHTTYLDGAVAVTQAALDLCAAEPASVKPEQERLVWASRGRVLTLLAQSHHAMMGLEASSATMLEASDALERAGRRHFAVMQRLNAAVIIGTNLGRKDEALEIVRPLTSAPGLLPLCRDMASAAVAVYEGSDPVGASSQLSRLLGTSSANDLATLDVETEQAMLDRWIVRVKPERQSVRIIETVQFLLQEPVFREWLETEGREALPSLAGDPAAPEWLRAQAGEAATSWFLIPPWLPVFWRDHPAAAAVERANRLWAAGSVWAAREEVERAAELLHHDGYDLPSMTIRYHLAQALEGIDDASAVENYRTVVDRYEAHRRLVRGEAEQAEVRKTMDTAYDRLTELLTARGEAGRGFDVAERARARQSLDMLGEALGGVHGWRRHDFDRFRDFETEDFLAWPRRREGREAEYESLLRGEPITYQEVTSMLRRLGRPTVGEP
ncbi:hypothetical protein EDD29_5279 [Actinocorallia herbida]|uniref:Uncharacterized protein n=1 Tax=Actinocorallia herbida TaxID=58109 RepID=A0A3N1D298_9ACTN|nr:hypothetical protein [Actinocorallia herbida]ROO87655.1 hypothetical protein EDD29_5279 [Actinocorallia herbida]